MKTKLVILIVFTAVLVSSCLVKSLHPYYKESDLIFEESLMGEWIDQDSSVWKIDRLISQKEFLGPEVESDMYSVSLLEDDGSKSKFQVALFLLDGKYYLDFLPETEENIGDNFASLHFLPTHSIARIEIFGNNNIAFFWYEQEWLNELFEQRKIRISHAKTNDESYVLTARTEDLQKFIIKYGGEVDIFNSLDPSIWNFNGTKTEYFNLINNEMENKWKDEDNISCNLVKLND